MANSGPQVRTGRVSKINYAAGTFEVTYQDRGGAVTCQMNAVSNGRYKMPEIGDIVNVEHNGNGTVAGTAMGTIWNKSNLPVNGRQGLFRQDWGRSKGRAYEEYDDTTGTYIAYAPSRLGRNSAGEIFDECAGPATITAGGQVMVRSSKSSASISAAGGVGIAAGKAVTVDAGTYLAVSSTGNSTFECGGDANVNVTGDTTEEFDGKVERTHNDDVTDEITGNVKKTVEGDVEEKTTGDITRSVEGNTEESLDGDLTMTVTGNVEITVGGTVISIDSGGNVTISGAANVDVEAAANLNITGATGDVTVDGISLVHHKHKDGGTGEPEKG